MQAGTSARKSLLLPLTHTCIQLKPCPGGSFFGALPRLAGCEGKAEPGTDPTGGQTHFQHGQCRPPGTHGGRGGNCSRNPTPRGSWTLRAYRRRPDGPPRLSPYPCRGSKAVGRTPSLAASCDRASLFY